MKDPRTRLDSAAESIPVDATMINLNFRVVKL